ncbi:hypothetical protein IT398_00595 [Candidatus Nomurabacteria bacterium]|nr:hypothetical protein [Candidatus Nomurabacteria bacterium]
MILDTWSNVLSASFQNLWWGVISFIPNVLVAIIIFVFGWLVGSVLGRWVAQIIKAIKIDQALEGIGTGDLMSRAGFRLDAGAFIGGLVKWFVVVVFLVAAADVLRLNQVTEFLRGIVLGYLPNVIVAALILILAGIIGEAMQKIVTGMAKAAMMPSAHLAGGIARWAIWIFGFIAALLQLQVAVVLLQTLFTGLVAMLALAGGLSFGLGGRDAAARYIEKLRHDIGGKSHN